MFSYLIKLLRMMPLLTFIISFFYFLLTFNFKYLILTIVLITNDYANRFIKYIIKSTFGDSIFGILGKRPKGAKDCGFFENSPIQKESYGMPSGHSQNIGFISIYLILNTLNQNYKKEKKLLIVSSLIILIFAIMYSRIYLNCHTYPQVIIGVIIGLLFGYIYYMNEDFIIKYIFNI